MYVGVIGLGQVGSAVKQLLAQKHTIFGRDLNFDEISGKKIDFLHICTPYNQQFESLVLQAINELQPRLTIIHSTIKPGTTNAIHKKSKAEIIHTPFMGVHPIKSSKEFIHGEGYSLFDYFDKFPKMIGPTTKKSGQLAKAHFESVGLKTELFDSAKETELAKILSTTYYGWNIIFEKWVYQLCQQNGANYDQVYTKYNTYYNQGYQEILPHVVRPVLKHHHGEIGGHCVIPNAEILQDWLADDFTEFLLQKNKQLCDEAKEK